MSVITTDPALIPVEMEAEAARAHNTCVLLPNFSTTGKSQQIYVCLRGSSFQQVKQMSENN